MSEQAMQLAAQAWCKPTTSGKEMDPALCMSFADILDEHIEASRDIAKQRDELLAHVNMLRHIVNQCGTRFANYAEIHAAKDSSPANLAKVRSNNGLASMCKEALAATNPKSNAD